MVVRYFRAIDGLGRIVLPAELLHHLNWEKGKMSVSIEEKDGCLIVSSVPAAGRPPAPPSPVKFQDSPDGQSKIISLPVSKKWKNRFPIFIRKAVFLPFLLFWGLDIHGGAILKNRPWKARKPAWILKKTGVTSISSPLLGARDGNRTRVFSLGSWHSAIELLTHLHNSVILILPDIFFKIKWCLWFLFAKRELLIKTSAYASIRSL